MFESRLPRAEASPCLPWLITGCIPSPSRTALRPLRGPPAPRLPGGRRPPPAEAGRRPGCAARGGRTAARGRRCGLPSAHPGLPPELLRAPEGPRKPPQRWVQRPRAVPNNFLPRGLRLAGADAGTPAPALYQEPLAHRYLHPRRRPPPAPFLTTRPWSSFGWLPKRRLRSWREVGAPGFRNDAALAGAAPRRGLQGASSSRLRGRCAQPELGEAEPKRPPTRTQRPRLPVATLAGPGH